MLHRHKSETTQGEVPGETFAGASASQPEPQPQTQLGAITANMRNVAAEIEDWKSAGGDSFTEILAGWTAPQYLLAARHALAAEPEGCARLKLLRQMAMDAVAFQRGGYWTPRLQLERERLVLQQEKHKHALALANQAPSKRRDVLQPLTDEERLAIIDKVDEIMGLKH